MIYIPNYPHIYIYIFWYTLIYSYHFLYILYINTHRYLRNPLGILGSFSHIHSPPKVTHFCPGPRCFKKKIEEKTPHVLLTYGKHMPKWRTRDKDVSQTWGLKEIYIYMTFIHGEKIGTKSTSPHVYFRQPNLGAQGPCRQSRRPSRSSQGSPASELKKSSWENVPGHPEIKHTWGSLWIYLCIKETVQNQQKNAEGVVYRQASSIFYMGFWGKLPSEQ